MRPDISQWRNGQSYDYFDRLSVEGLAWECLRRNEGYQQLYGALVKAETEAAPLKPEAEYHWGLRFRNEAKPACPGTGCPVVPARRSGRCHSDPATRIPRSNTRLPARRHRRASR